MLLSPRDLLRAIHYHKALSVVTPGGASLLKQGVHHYIRVREANRGWWNKTAMQHRKSLKALYALFHIKPAPFANRVLFKREATGPFRIIKELKDMDLNDEAKAVAEAAVKAVQPAYNYFGIEPEKMSDKAGIVVGSLGFYVFYTVLYGFALMYMFEGWGLKMGAH